MYKTPKQSCHPTGRPAESPATVAKLPTSMGHTQLGWLWASEELVSPTTGSIQPVWGYLRWGGGRGEGQSPPSHPLLTPLGPAGRRAVDVHCQAIGRWWGRRPSSPGLA